MMKLFLDTNILLDILQGKRPSHQTSSLILEGAKKQLYEVQISIQSIADVTYIAIRNGIPFDAVSRLSSWMLDHVNVDGPDSFHLRDAIEGHTGDFEDDLHYAYAQDNACDIIITGDRQFIQRKTPGDILMMTPEEFVGRMTR
ncbi:MAG: PIN domain-containing protein [Bacteroidales bacterium]|nr:PIN domain-containing protein [Bacteroidales bacterium]